MSWLMITNGHGELVQNVCRYKIFFKIVTELFRRKHTSIYSSLDRLIRDEYYENLHARMWARTVLELSELQAFCCSVKKYNSLDLCTLSDAPKAQILIIIIKRLNLRFVHFTRGLTSITDCSTPLNESNRLFSNHFHSTQRLRL